MNHYTNKNSQYVCMSFMLFHPLFFFSFFLFYSSSMCTGLIVVLPWESGKVTGVFVACPLKSVASAKFP